MSLLSCAVLLRWKGRPDNTNAGGRQAIDSAARYFSYQDLAAPHAGKAGSGGRPAWFGQYRDKGKGVGKGGKGGKSKGKSKGKDTGKSQRQVFATTAGQPPRGGGPAGGGKVNRQSAVAERRDHLAGQEDRLLRIEASMKSFMNFVKDLTGDKVSVNSLKEKVTEVFEQVTPASKPKATSGTLDLENAQRKVNHCKEQRRLLEAACKKKYQALKKTMANLQSVVQHELPTAVSRLEEIVATQKGELDEAVIAASAAPDECTIPSIGNATLGTPVGEGSSQHDQITLGSAPVLPHPAQHGGSKSSAPSAMSDASKRCRDPDDGDEPSAKLSSSRKEFEGSEFLTAAARGDDGTPSEPEEDFESDTLYQQLMDNAESKVLRYGPIKAWSKEQHDSDADL